MLQGAPPQWLQNWSRFVAALFQAERLLCQVMLQAVKLRIRPRRWLTFQDPLEMDNMMKLMDMSQQPCQHPSIRRYGNRHGSFAKRQDCQKGWRWSDEQDRWVDPAPSRRPQLPSPASSTASTFVDKNRKPRWTLAVSISSTTSEPARPAPIMDAAKPPPTTKEKKSTARPKSSGAGKRRAAIKAEEAEEISDEYDWSTIEP